MKNPFVTNGYAGSEYFCDRIQETKNIRSLLLNENNIALISPRRLGKTDLIWHVFDDEAIRKEYHCFVVDIYATKNLGDFVNMLGKAVMDDVPLPASYGNHFKNAGAPSVSLMTAITAPGPVHPISFTGFRKAQGLLLFPGQEIGLPAAVAETAGQPLGHDQGQGGGQEIGGDAHIAPLIYLTFPIDKGRILECFP